MSARSVAFTTLLLGASLVPGAVPGATPADPILQQLAGRWTLEGEVRGKPVRYLGEARWLLKDAWLCLMLAEQATPPGYEARVYLGFDAKTQEYVAHWLDQFGAAGARVVGTGHRNGQTLVLDFPYMDGAFRDTLTLDADARQGSLLLESQGKDGSWSTFASYRMVRRGTAQAKSGTR
jgi:hypothetical protein